MRQVTLALNLHQPFFRASNSPLIMGTSIKFCKGCRTSKRTFISLRNAFFSAPFCNNIFKDVQDSGAFARITWRQLKPMLLGKVVYTPNSSVVLDVLREVCSMLYDLCGYIEERLGAEIFVYNCIYCHRNMSTTQRRSEGGRERGWVGLN